MLQAVNEQAGQINGVCVILSAIGRAKPRPIALDASAGYWFGSSARELGGTHFHRPRKLSPLSYTVQNKPPAYRESP